MHYVYVIKNENKEFYVGFSNDLRRRFTEHNSEDNSGYTRSGKPWSLLYYEAYAFEKLARLREKKLKHHGNALRELKKRILPAT